MYVESLKWLFFVVVVVVVVVAQVIYLLVQKTDDLKLIKEYINVSLAILTRKHLEVYELSYSCGLI